MVQKDAENNDQGTTEKHTVEILHHRGEWVYVRGTLQDGHNIICNGMHRVVPGQRVVMKQPNRQVLTVSAMPDSFEQLPQFSVSTVDIPSPELPVGN